MTLLADTNGAQVHHCSWHDLISVVGAEGGCDLVCTDTPYSSKTHNGHDDAVDSERSRDWARRNGGKGFSKRRAINYQYWTPEDVREFVTAWAPLNRGWFVSMTDHVLDAVWQDAFDAAGLYSFAPIAYMATGSRVRLLGDGPSLWSVQIVVARPRSEQFVKWGTLPGGYVLPEGYAVDCPITGGKEPWIMQRLVEDYSRPDQLVVDPCGGAGTTAIGAIRSRRRAIVGDINDQHAGIAAQWVANPHRQAPGTRERIVPGQVSMFAEGAA